MRSLATCGWGGAGENQLVQLSEAQGHLSGVELDHQLRCLGIEAPDDAEVPVVDLLVIVVFDLHHLVADAAGRAEALATQFARRVQRLLQIEIERPSAEAAAVHRAQHLDVAHRVPGHNGPESARGRCGGILAAPSSPLAVGALDEMEVTGPNSAATPAFRP
jgi:hypothetical protein